VLVVLEGSLGDLFPRATPRTMIAVDRWRAP